MYTALPLLCVLVVAEAPHVDVKFEQVAPVPAPGKVMERSKDQPRAVVLLHGLYPLSFSDASVTRARLAGWQEGKSDLVKGLAKLSDVYGFAYSQDACLNDIVAASKLDEDVATLRKLGYTEIVLVGHSAGGVLARQFVEDHPQCGVTKVIQVCPPNGGSELAKIPPFRKIQKPFMDCLTKESRQECLMQRKDKTIPTGVEFLCIIGTGGNNGDGVVCRECQWTEELRKQGIPAICVPVSHAQAMRTTKGTEAIVDAIKTKQSRWDEDKVRKSSREILNN